MKNHAELPSHLAGYAALRRMRQLDAAGRAEEATALVESAQRERPSLAVAVALAGRLREAGRNEAAGAALEAVVRPGKFESTEWALAREAALLLESGGRASRAVEVWRRLFAAENLPRVARTAWLPEAVQCAAAAKENAQADAWRAEHAALAR